MSAADRSEMEQGSQGRGSSLPPGGRAIDEGSVRWSAWTPAEIMLRLRNLDAPWAFAAGWALDLFRGKKTREHEDIEVAIPAAAFAGVRKALQPYEFELVGSGLSWPLTDQAAFAATHQTWLRDPLNDTYVLDVFREPHDGDTWICRRDTSIRRPYSEVVRRDHKGRPFLVPEIVLLFKAKHIRPKDVSDFEATAPLLDREARGWLIDALMRVHPDHPWINRLKN